MESLINNKQHLYISSNTISSDDISIPVDINSLDDLSSRIIKEGKYNE